MALECVSCGFSTNLRANLTRHNLSKRHIELCVVVETPVSLLTAKVSDLERQIIELKHQIEMDKILIEGKNQLIECLKSTPKRCEEKTKKEKEDKEESKEAIDKEMEHLESKLSVRNEEEQQEFLLKYKTKSAVVTSWITNKMTELLCHDSGNICNEMIPDAKEDCEDVKQFNYKGTEYLLAVDGVVYDVNSQDEVGFYDGESIRYK